MAVKHAKEADLWPLNVQIGFVFRFEYIQNNTDSVLVVISDYSLVGVGRIRLYNSAFLLTGFRWLVVFKLNRFRIQ